MDASCFVIPAQFGYMQIPATTLRHFADGIFPSLAKCAADSVASGYMHRWVGGHDLIMDVFSTVGHDGVQSGLHQAGHILLTDFPTKAGIPIPLLSAQGLGGWLVNSVGISKGWLCLNMFETGIGIFAVADASSQLFAALAGELPMTAWTAFSTFGMGTGYILIGTETMNPLLLGAGVEKILAGVVSGLDELKSASALLQIDPLQFFGAGLVSAIIGFTISRALLGQDTAESVKMGLQNGAVGALLSASTGVGLGVMLGLAGYAYGKALAQRKTPAFSRESFIMLEAEIFSSDPDVAKMAELSREQLFTLDEVSFELPQVAMFPPVAPDANWFHRVDDEFMKKALFPSVQGFPPLEPGDAFSR